MTVSNVKSSVITNDDATPRVPSNAYLDGAHVREKIGYVAKGAETDTSTWRFVRIPSGARITSIEWACSAIAGFTSIDIGLYDTAANGGALVNEAIFASAVDMHSGAAFTDVTQSVTTIDLLEKRVWELLGLSVDPMKDYDVVWLGDTAGTNTGKLACRVRYTL